MKPLSTLPMGARARVISVVGRDSLRHRLRDFGLIFGTEIIPLHRAPFGDPIAYLIRGAVIALRGEDAENILLSPINQ